MKESPEIRSRHEIAFELHEAGFSLIPLIGKKPAIQQWRMREKERATEVEVRNWLASGNLNIGIVCGRQIAVIDTDEPKATEWCMRNMEETPLMVRTPRGMHWYYRWVSGVRNAVKVRGLWDVRGEGGCVVAPGSVVDGKTYELVGHITRDLPEFDLKWLPESSGYPKAIIEPDDIRRVSRAKAYIRTIFAISGQNGHNKTYWAVCRMRDFGLTRSEAWALLLAWNESNAVPPWNAKELKHKLDSVYGKE